MGQLRGSKVLAMVVPMCAEDARWAASRDEWCLNRTNLTFSLIRFCADSSATAPVLATSGLLASHANSFSE
jgi:hypothetical protein